MWLTLWWMGIALACDKEHRLANRLLEAADAGNHAVVDKLLAAGVDPNTPSDRAYVPLSWAADAGVVDRLLDAGAQPLPGEVHACGATRSDVPLAKLISHRNYDAARRLMARSTPAVYAQVDLLSGFFYTSLEPLGPEAERMIVDLLAWGADPASIEVDPPHTLWGVLENRRASNALYLALIDAGRDPGELLPFSVSIGRPELTRALLERGLDPAVRSGRGNTAWDLAVSLRDRGRDYPEDLLAALEVRAPDAVLVAAVQAGDLDALRAGLAEGRSTRGTLSRSGAGLVHLAVDSGDPAILQALLDAGVSPGSRDGEGHDAAGRAAATDQVALLPLLLDDPLSPEAIDAALAAGARRSVAWFMEHGYTPTVRFDAGPRELDTVLAMGAAPTSPRYSADVDAHEGHPGRVALLWWYGNTEQLQRRAWEANGGRGMAWNPLPDGVRSSFLDLADALRTGPGAVQGVALEAPAYNEIFARIAADRPGAAWLAEAIELHIALYDNEPVTPQDVAVIGTRTVTETRHVRTASQVEGYSWVGTETVTREVGDVRLERRGEEDFAAATAREAELKAALAAHQAKRPVVR